MYNRIFALTVMLVMMILAEQVSVAQNDPSDASQGAIDYILENPEHVGFACYEGDLEPVLHQADESFSIASSFKIFVLAELGRQIDLGEFDPEAPIPLSDVNAYLLPTTDGEAHNSFLATLGEDVVDVSLAQVLNAMIQFSSNAATDYLIHRLGVDGFETLYEDLNLINSTPPKFTLLGLYLASENHVDGSVDANTFTEDSLRIKADELELRFLTDEDWRMSEIAYLQEKADQIIQQANAGDISGVTDSYNHQASFSEHTVLMEVQMMC